jgi:putative hydrolase of the HAD superfamily
MPHIRAVLFDYGLVLTGLPDPAAWARMEALLHTDNASFHPLYWKYRDDYDRGTLSGSAYWTRIAHDLDRQLDDAALAALLAADTALWTQPNQPMIDWAATLQRAGVRTGILSNLGDAMELGIRSILPWLQGFDTHTFSHTLGIAKPTPAIYLHAAQSLKIPTQEILFIDDRAENIAAAKVAGMQAIRYIDHSSFLEEFRKSGLEVLPSPTA